ncbi:Cytoplasmic tRNA 2-thiolation protein 2 [Coemansia guatemalensis]|uniref:Cytoplasmic tRNA 2-thiolation protein 2 n=1 Tax=Coemansia guatemalensis TaxID=2761395 RepID=A0A9W8HXC6_9FUNG|nr:Cytoplasmic tRNA 2-thiolation protein 2 [Coemansia guatemalensis]
MSGTPSRGRERVPGMCIKCKVAKPSVTIRQSLYCKECFIRTSIVKFRTGQSRLRKRASRSQTKALVAFSGGGASSAMLKLVADHQSSARKGVDATPAYTGIVVGHVDESCLFPEAPEEEIRAIAAESGLLYRTLALEDIFTLADGRRTALIEIVQASIAPGAEKDQFCARLVRPSNKVSNKEYLTALFASLGSATDREDMLDIIKAFLVRQLAREEGCEVVLMGDSGTRIATKTVALTSRGRGFSLPLEVAAESRWFGDLSVWRPMRDFSAKEIAFFNHWTGQKSAAVPTFTTGGPRRASIDRLTEAFIAELDQGFSSTVPTVCRTMQKLEPRDEALAAPPCLICGMPAEGNAQAWRSRLTISSSGAGGVSASARSSPSATLPESSCLASGDTSSLLEIARTVCYACQSLLHHASPGIVLPEFCAKRLQAVDASDNSTHETAEAQREALRRQIDEFLLDDDDGTCDSSAGC